MLAPPVTVTFGREETLEPYPGTPSAQAVIKSSRARLRSSMVGPPRGGPISETRLRPSKTTYTKLA
jgi:hypothetical protein